MKNIRHHTNNTNNEEINNTEITEENNNEFRDIEEIEEIEINLFNKLKKVNNNHSQNNINLSIEEQPTLEDRIKKIETMIESYNTKFDLLFNLLKK